jgi:hypothetical protein
MRSRDEISGAVEMRSRDGISVVSLSLSKGGSWWRASDPGVRRRDLGVVLSGVEARL